MQKQLAQDLLIETALFYNSSNRSIEDNSYRYCVYDDGKGHRCALGRIMTDEGIERIKTDGNNGGFSCENVRCDYGSGVIVEKWRPIVNSNKGWIFLYLLQGLHDRHGNWDEAGITEQGMDHVRHIVSIFELDLDHIKGAIEEGRKKT